MISAIVLNWNGKRFLKECFASLLNQSFKDYELLMVDNGSSDGSVEFMKDNFPQVKILPMGGNIGFCRAMNAGIRATQGGFIALFNNDVVVDRDWMAQMNARLEENPDVGICASKVLFYKEADKINSAGDSFNTSGEAHNRGFGQENDGRYNTNEFVFSATAAACIYRRRMLEVTGLFDEDFFNTYEDIDLSFRAHMSGWKCLYVPEAVVYHHWLGTIGYFSPMNIFYMSKNNLNILIKNMPAELIKKFAAPIFKKHLHISMAMGSNGSSSAFIKGKLCYLLGLPQMLRKRNTIQKERRISAKELEDLLEKD